MAILSSEQEACLTAAFRCARACGECVEHCVTQASSDYTAPGISCQDALDACLHVISAISRESPRYEPIVAACAELCTACALLCERFEEAVMQRCTEACRRCAEACRALLSGSAWRAAAPATPPAH